MLLKLVTAGLAATLIAAPVAAAQGDGDRASRSSVQTLSVIGDIPYGDALIAEFPADVAQINADPDVR
ncbi:MAG: hypothetical protein QOF69_3074, partial [Solirubrobacteraceae bacterium]|nr:hypothetical protein [Solirubrobacteraceae bacterium]